MATAMSATSFAQLSFNAAGAIEFLRDVAELVEPRRVFAEGRRQRCQSEIYRNVVLAERGRAYIPSRASTFDCVSPLAGALKTLVVGAEAVSAVAPAVAAAAASFAPRVSIHRVAPRAAAAGRSIYCVSAGRT
mmetsp:Transcript_11993/g.36912  ORF Transcript_11993/g.36912 Transcript_11993/m.36912 type:complete len:133 (-) Transcript_11993:769-1167(-)